MLLAIDVGNTNTVFALIKDDTLLESWRLQTLNARSPDEYAALLTQLLALTEYRLEDCSRTLISSVVPEVNFHLRRFIEKYLKHDPLFITKDHVGIDIDLDTPDEVGADRLVNAVAVNENYSAPAIVIDFGTATTFDVIDDNGAYAGGVIAPGINLSINALHQAASKLPKVSVQKPEAAIGKSTSKAMRAGVFYGYLGLIEGIVKNIKDELGNPSDLKVIATGGLAPLFAQDTDIIQTVDQDLTLKGLIELSKKV